jgi:uncharacterized protein
VDSPLIYETNTIIKVKSPLRNSESFKNYLNLLESAGLNKYSGQQVRQRGSSSKFQVLNTALSSIQSHLTLKEARQDPARWGRLTESTIGAHLAKRIGGKGIRLFFWNERNVEVDFVLARGHKIAAIEIKSGRLRDNLPGMAAFARQFKVEKKWLVGKEGIPVEEFLKMEPEKIL